jgi:hypothetical protein
MHVHVYHKNEDFYSGINSPALGTTQLVVSRMMINCDVLWKSTANRRSKSKVDAAFPINFTDGLK